LRLEVPHAIRAMYSKMKNTLFGPF